jgi:hypothetical protein
VNRSRYCPARTLLRCLVWTYLTNRSVAREAASLAGFQEKRIGACRPGHEFINGQGHSGKRRRGGEYMRGASFPSLASLPTMGCSQPIASNYLSRPASWAALKRPGLRRWCSHFTSRDRETKMRLFSSSCVRRRLLRSGDHRDPRRNSMCGSKSGRANGLLSTGRPHSDRNRADAGPSESPVTKITRLTRWGCRSSIHLKRLGPLISGIRRSQRIT